MFCPPGPRPPHSSPTVDDRRAQLLRQRATIAQHLAWLDAEIAAAPPPAVSPPLRLTPPTPTNNQPSPADFAPPPAPELTKRGCWIIFFIATTLLLGGDLLAIYYIYR